MIKASLLKKICLTFLLSLLVFLTACENGPQPPSIVEGVIVVDGEEKAYQVPKGTSVAELLSSAGITLSNGDRVVPDDSAIITESNTTVKVVRVTETFEVEELIIPYNQQTIRNETMTEGESRLVQAGENGLEEITYRYLYEDGVEVSKTIFKRVLIAEPVPEITMIGVKSPLLSLSLSEPLVYLTAGNAWMMKENTENRIPLVTTGDLDGRVFEISPDQQWLLYSRAETRDTNTINSLWVVSLEAEESEPIALPAQNVIHFADWHPIEPATIFYSTVEPRETPPGWQANNDLIKLTIDFENETSAEEILIDVNAGGIYGWWGTDFSWSQEGKLAFARPDTIGYIDLSDNTYQTLVTLNPYNTREDWAWTPGISWDSQGMILFTVTHPSENEIENPEDSRRFNLSAILTTHEYLVDIVINSGMFAYPAAAPADVPDALHGKIIFLQAIFPEESEDSRYQIILMDTDGSNQSLIFPDQGSPGLSPQQVKWNGSITPARAEIGFIYQGNLWIYDLIQKSAHQITGDGLTTHLDW
jgi:hypothetical protein